MYRPFDFGTTFHFHDDVFSLLPLIPLVCCQVGSYVMLVYTGLGGDWLRMRPMCTGTPISVFRFPRQNIPESTKGQNCQLWFFLKKGGRAMDFQRDNLQKYSSQLVLQILLGMYCRMLHMCQERPAKSIMLATFCVALMCRGKRLHYVHFYVRLPSTYQLLIGSRRNC